jgi:hypothetical protein
MKEEIQYHCAYFTTSANTNLTGINIFAETMSSALTKFKELTGLDEPHYIIVK